MVTESSGRQGLIEAQRGRFFKSLTNSGVDLGQVAERTTYSYMKYPRMWEFLHGPNPSLLLDFFSWMDEDEARVTSSIDRMEWFEVGFHKLPLAYVTDEKTNEVVTSIQANFYSEEFPGNEDSHGHSRNAKVVFYAHPDARQIEVQSRLLPHNTRPVTDLPVVDVPIVVLGLIPREPGQSAQYHPCVVGEGRVAQLVTTAKAPLSEEIFNSIGVHYVGFEGPGVAVSIHVKGRRESPALNDRKGLMNYKGLTQKQAEVVINEIPEEVGAPRTLILPTRDFYMDTFNSLRSQPTLSDGQRLLRGALHTAEKLVK